MGSIGPTVAPAPCGRIDSLPSTGALLGGALRSWCGAPAWLGAQADIAAPPLTASATVDADALVVDMYHAEGASLVRLARLFVDDRNAAEDLVQEAFIRLARNAHRIHDLTKAPAYLRSIVLNLARDENRRGLVSMRHRSPSELPPLGVVDEIELRDDQRRVLVALRALPARQRSCLVLRYYDELGIDEIATTLDLSRNSVKTHLQRGLASLQRALGEATP